MTLVFFEHCRQHGISLPPGASNFSLSYTTTIPRQRGLSGSSAIATAVLNCLLRHYGLEAAIPPADRPQLVLAAEAELGIAAGLQDRVIQVGGGWCWSPVCVQSEWAEGNAAVGIAASLRSEDTHSFSPFCSTAAYKAGVWRPGADGLFCRGSICLGAWALHVPGPSAAAAAVAHLQASQDLGRQGG